MLYDALDRWLSLTHLDGTRSELKIEKMNDSKAFLKGIFRVDIFIDQNYAAAASQSEEWE